MSEQPGEGGTGQKAPPSKGQPDRTAWRAVWLGGGAILLAAPLWPLGLVLACASLWFGFRAARNANRTRGPVLAPVAGIVLGGLGLTLAIMLAAMHIMLGSELDAYTDCMEAANTNTDERVCEDRYLSEVEKRFDLPEGFMDRYRDFL